MPFNRLILHRGKMDPVLELSKFSKDHYQQLTCNNPSAILSDVKHEVEEPINWKNPSRQVEMEKDDEYRDLGSKDKEQPRMLADSPTPKYNKKESGVEVDETISDNQEVNSCFHHTFIIVNKTSVLFHVKAVWRCDFIVQNRSC